MGNDAGVHPASIAACNGRVPILQALHVAGMDLGKPMFKMRDGERLDWSVAHTAAHHGSRRCLKFLGETVGVDILKKNEEGECILLNVAMDSPHSKAFTNARAYL